MLALRMLASNNNDKFLASVSFRLAIYLAFATAIKCARKQTVNYNHLFRGQCFSPFPWPSPNTYGGVLLDMLWDMRKFHCVPYALSVSLIISGCLLCAATRWN